MQLIPHHKVDLPHPLTCPDSILENLRATDPGARMVEMATGRQHVAQQTREDTWQDGQRKRDSPRHRHTGRSRWETMAT